MWLLAKGNMRNQFDKLYCAGWGITAPLYWSPDGTFLYATNGVGDLVRVEMDKGFRSSVVTPAAWKVGDTKPVIWHARWDGADEHLHCFIGRGFSAQPLELWTVSSGWHAELLASDPKWILRCVDVNTENEDFFLCWGDVDSGVGRICVGNKEGKPVTIYDLVNAKRPRFVVLSPAGDHCLFAISNVDSMAALSLRAMALRTGEQWELGDYWFASWSPDGNKIAAVFSDQQLVVIDWNKKCVEMKIEVSSECRLPPSRQRSYAMVPEWSSDSTYIAFNLCFSGPPTPESMLSKEVGFPATFVADLNEKWLSPLATCTTRCAWRPSRA